jgi:Cysteine-rich CPXCG
LIALEALRLPGARVNWRVEVSGTIQCPFCGQSFEVTLDTSAPQQKFITDCEVCCRPMAVSAECAPGEILRLDVTAN